MSAESPGRPSPLRRRIDALPAGSLPISLGLVATGLTSYLFVVVSARALGPESYGALGVLWVLVFTLGPGIFAPFEQEVSRAVTMQRIAGLGALPVVRRAAVLGLVIVGLLSLAAVLASGFIVPRLFRGQPLLLAALLLAFLGYCVQHVARGVAAAEHRFTAYGWVIGAEGALRVLPLPLLLAVGVGGVAPYGLVLAAAPLLAGLGLLLHFRRHPVDLGPGPSMPWGQLGRAVGFLLVGSVAAQLLINLPQLAVELLATEAEEADAGRFFTALVLTRLPLMLFAAVQASQLPRLTRHAERRDAAGFRSALVQLVGLLGGLGLAFLVAAVALGPLAVSVLFGDEFVVGRQDFAYLAAATAAFLIALAFAQGLVALASHAWLPGPWCVGLIAFTAVVLLRDAPLLLRVEQATLAGCAVAAAAMGFTAVLRARIVMASPDGPT